MYEHRARLIYQFELTLEVHLFAWILLGYMKLKQCTNLSFLYRYFRRVKLLAAIWVCQLSWIHRKLSTKFWYLVSWKRHLFLALLCKPWTCPGKILYVPRIVDRKSNKMDFVRVYSLEDLETLPAGTWGIKEPGPTWEGRRRESSQPESS